MEKVALFIRNGLVGHITLNRLVPAMLARGFRPALYNTGEPAPRRPGAPELAPVGFYETGLLKNVTIPFLDAANDLTLPGGGLRPDLNYSFRQLVRHHGLEYLDVPNVNAPDFVDHVRNDKDLIGSVSIRILQIFKPGIIAVMESKGFMWNLHTGILPPYKGVHAPYRAAANDEPEYGWTLHRIDNGIDTGPLLGFTRAKLDPKRPILDTYLDHAHPGADLVLEKLEEFRLRGPLPGQPQTDAERQSGYHTHPTSAEMQAFAARGLRFIFNPAAVRDLYLEKFSLPETSQSQGLNLRLAQAIGGWESAQKPGNAEPGGQAAEPG